MHGRISWSHAGARLQPRARVCLCNPQTIHVRSRFPSRGRVLLSVDFLELSLVRGRSCGMRGRVFASVTSLNLAFESSVNLIKCLSARDPRITLEQLLNTTNPRLITAIYII